MSSLDWWQVKLGLILFGVVTLVTPLVILPVRISFQSGIGWNIERVYYYIFGYSIFESEIPPYWGGIGFTYTVALTIALISSLIYTYLVTYYCMNLSNLRAAIIVGLVGQLIPFMVVLYALSPEAWTSGDYVGPLPIHFIVGLIVMWIAKSKAKFSDI